MDTRKGTAQGIRNRIVALLAMFALVCAGIAFASSGVSPMKAYAAQGAGSVVNVSIVANGTGTFDDPDHPVTDQRSMISHFAQVSGNPNVYKAVVNPNGSWTGQATKNLKVDYQMNGTGPIVSTIIPSSNWYTGNNDNAASSVSASNKFAFNKTTETLYVYKDCTDSDVYKNLTAYVGIVGAQSPVVSNIWLVDRDRNVYIHKTIDGNNAYSTGSTHPLQGDTYYGPSDLALNALGSLEGYDVDSLRVYAVTWENSSDATTSGRPPQTWTELRSNLYYKNATDDTHSAYDPGKGDYDKTAKADFWLDSHGDIQISESVAVHEVFIDARLSTKTASKAETPWTSLVGKNEIKLGNSASNYAYRINQNGTWGPWRTWRTNPTNANDFTGLNPGTRYSFQQALVDSSGRVIDSTVSDRITVTTKSERQPWTPPYSVGDSWDATVNMYAHYDYPTPGEGIGIGTTFLTTLVGGSDGVPGVGGDYAFTCVVPGAAYPAYGEHYGYVTCVEVNMDQGYARFVAWFSGDGGQDFAGSYDVTFDMPCYIELTKTSDQGFEAPLRHNYNLQGAEYGIYTDSSCSGDAVDIIRSGYDNEEGASTEGGYGRSIKLNPGVYYVKEITPASGYTLDTADVWTVDLHGGDTVNLAECGPTVADSPIRITPPIIVKNDFELYDLSSGDPSRAQGNGTLEGAEFTVRYYDNYDGNANFNKQPVRTWVLKTKYDAQAAKAYAKFSESSDYFVSGDAFFKTVAGDIVLPIGTYTLQETKAPTGYHICDTGLRSFVIDDPTEYVDQDHAVWSLTDAQKAAWNAAGTFYDQVFRGNIEVQKLDSDYLVTTDGADRNGRAHLEGATFGIYNRSPYRVLSPVDGHEVETNGLVCTIVTDSEGKASTDHTSATRLNLNEWGVNCTAVSKNWTGALAYGQYEVVEITPPTGYMLNKTWHGMAIAPNSGIVPLINSANAAELAGKGVTLDKAVAHMPQSADGTTWVSKEGALIQFGTNTALGEEGNEQARIADDAIRGGVRLGKIDRQNQQYKPQGKGSLEGSVFGIFSTNPNKVTVYAPSDGLAGYNGFGTETSTYRNTKVQGHVAWTYPAWDQAAGRANGVYDYNPYRDPNFEYGKQTSDGVFIGYITTRAVEENGRIEYVAETDNFTLPYGTYVLREMDVPVESGYLFDEVSMAWRISFGIGDDFTYVENDAKTGAGWNWYSHHDDYRFSECKYRGITPLNGYYLSDSPKYKAGAYDRAYVDGTPSPNIVPEHGPYYNRIVPTKAHDEALNYQMVDFTNDSKYCASNYISRGDLKIIKKDTEGKYLAYVPFLVTSLTTGESHVVVTDANGVADTRQSSDANRQIAPSRRHTYMTDRNDDALIKNAAGIPVIPLDGDGNLGDLDKVCKFNSDGYWIDDSANRPELHWEYGTWFNGRTDTWTIHAQKDRLNHNGYTGTESPYIDNPNDQSHSSYPEPLGAFPYDDYLIQELQVSAADIEDVDGKTVHAPDTSEYMMISEPTFTITSNGIGDHSEYVDGAGKLHTSYNTVSNIAVALVERELINRGRPDIQTTLSADENVEYHFAKATNVKLWDTVNFYNLDEGEKYYMQGKLFIVEYDSSGSAVPGTQVAISEKVEFVPNSESGSVKIPFEFDATDLHGRSVVCYEYLTSKTGQPIASHENPGDEGQTVSFPTVGTRLVDKADGDKEVFVTDEVVLTDTVGYEGLVPGSSYKIKGELKVVSPDGTASPARDENGEAIVSESDVFMVTNETINGTVDIDFKFDGGNLAGKTLVAFEYLYIVDEEAGVEELVSDHAVPDDKGQTVYTPAIHTTATDTITGEHVGLAGDPVGLDDVVAYENLLFGEKYTMYGTVMDKTTGEKLTYGNKAYAASQEFFAGYDSVFDLNAVEQAFATKGVAPADESFSLVDVARPGQTVTIEITGAEQGATAQMVFGEDMAIALTFSGDNQIFEIPGIKVGTVAGEPDENNHVSGTVNMHFDLDAEAILNKTLVVFEYCEWQPSDDVAPGTPTRAAEHEDIDDEGQSVDYPSVHTNATDAATGAHDGLAEGTVKINDVVSYEHLVAGQAYKVEGVLMDKETGEAITDADGNEITASAEFTAGEDEGAVVEDDGKHVSGSVLVVFEVPGALIEGKTVVVFEDLLYNGKLIAVHADITDEEQSVYYPLIHTTALMGNGAKEAMAAEDAVVADTVEYFNLIPGETYRMSGILMDKTTGEPALDYEGNQVTASTEFTAEEASGTVVIKFEFNARSLAYRDTVAFEVCERVKRESDVADEYILVARHEDINDSGQTVSFREESGLADEPIVPHTVEVAPVKTEQVPIVKTGDVILYSVIGVAVIAAIVGAIVLIRRRMMK